MPAHRTLLRRLKARLPRMHYLRLPVLRGPLLGCLWTLSGRGKIGRVLCGTYEKEQTLTFGQLVKPGDVVLDAGANIGYYTLLASLLVKQHGQVVAFEPVEHNLFHLRKHLAINRRTNVEVIGEAVGQEVGVVRFTLPNEKGTGTGRVIEQGGMQVRQTTIDEVVGQRQLTPTLIKIDVEGAELGVLQGSEETLRRARPQLLLSTHSRIVTRQCIDFLRQAGYCLQPLDGAELSESSEFLCSPNTLAAAAA